jgi:hypothetical protein
MKYLLPPKVMQNIITCHHLFCYDVNMNVTVGKNKCNYLLPRRAKASLSSVAFPKRTLLIMPITPSNRPLTIRRKVLGTNVEISTLTGLFHGNPIPALSNGILFLASRVMTLPISSRSTRVGMDLTLNFSPRYWPRCPMASVGGNANQFIWVKYCPKASIVRQRDIHTISNSSFLPIRAFILL